MATSNELVLVTGASGYIASWATKYALDKGYRVRGTVRDPTNAKKTAALLSLPGARERLELVALDLELSDQAAFNEALKGVTLVLHMASPVDLKYFKDENELIRPAVNGVLSVLRAAHRSPSVKRVVVTSSVVSAWPRSARDGHLLGEDAWTDEKDPRSSAYVKSKTYAEKAAWEFVKDNKPSWAFATILPSFNFGPALGSEVVSSMDIGFQLLTGKMARLPHINFGIVDVRDVARAHVNALEVPVEAMNGHRFFVSNENMWFKDIAERFKRIFGPMGYTPVTAEGPYALFWLLSFFDDVLPGLLPMFGVETFADTEPSKKLLGLTYTPMDKTLTEFGHFLIQSGNVKKLPGYKPISEHWSPLTA